MLKIVESCPYRLERLLREISSSSQGVASSSIDANCLRHFHKWASSANLGLGYLLYANRNSSPDTIESFATKVAAHLGSSLETLRKEEIVTLMLLVYFRDGSHQKVINIFITRYLCQLLIYTSHVMIFMTMFEFRAYQICRHENYTS
jgi:hypothetical protein